MPSAYVKDAIANATVASRFALNATTGFTVSFWVKWASGGQSFTGDVFEQYGSTVNRDGYSVSILGNQLRVTVNGSAGTTSTNLGGQNLMSPSRWNHYTATFDDATNEVRGYHNGKLFGVATNTRDMTANGTTCNTRIFPVINATFVGYCFDIQVFPDIVVPAADVPLLMNPTYTYQGLQARYCGLEFRGVAPGSTLYDESGNGNNATTNASATMQQADEPPFRPTFA